MAKAYWVVCYREVTSSEKLAAYAQLAVPAIQSQGGRVLVRGIPAEVYESGQLERTVVIEFDSVEHAVAVHDSPPYQAALKALDGGAVRDMRVIAGA